MSRENLHEAARRWLTQARDDLVATGVLTEAGQFAQACFWAQQSAEKAIKAIWILLDMDPWGHSIARLIREMPAEHRSRMASMLDEALYLDKMYIPTRYPDALADLTPAEAYTKREAHVARSHATRFVEVAEEWFKEMDV